MQTINKHQVRVVFCIPQYATNHLFSHLPLAEQPSEHLAYVQWFSPFTQPDPVHGMYSVTRSFADPQTKTERLCSVVDVDRLLCSASLVPRIGQTEPGGWTSDDILEKCPRFWVNPFKNVHMYKLTSL